MKLKYIVFITLIAAVVMSMVAIGFANRRPSGSSDTLKLEFAALVANPAEYNQKSIILDAFIFLGFETNVLCESLELSGMAPEYLIPRGALIWIEGSIPPQVYESLYVQQAKGPVERFGKVRVNGGFHYGGQYGHLGGYNLQFVPSKLALLVWSP